MRKKYHLGDSSLPLVAQNDIFDEPIARVIYLVLPNRRSVAGFLLEINLATPWTVGFPIKIDSQAETCYYRDAFVKKGKKPDTDKKHGCTDFSG